MHSTTKTPEEAGEGKAFVKYWGPVLLQGVLSRHPGVFFFHASLQQEFHPPEDQTSQPPG